MKSSDRRRSDLRKRLAEARADGRKRCWVFDCQEPPGNTSGKGLGRFCRKHLEHYRRHGDPLKASYRATRINPYRKSAAIWLAKNADDLLIKASLRRVTGLMTSAGAAVPPRNLRALSAEAKSKSVWARLRDREVTAAEVAAAIIGVVLCHADDPQKGKIEYRRTQIAKVLNRMAGGEVKRWPTHATDPGLPKERVLRWFPASEGLVLRILGKEAEEAVDLIMSAALEASAELGDKHA